MSVLPIALTVVAPNDDAKALAALDRLPFPTPARTRLGPGAWEVTINGDMSAIRATVDAAFTYQPLDYAVQPTAFRQKALLLADMDSTIITIECIDELADFAGVKAHVAEITERAMRGELDFEGALLARMALLKGLPMTALATCRAERVQLTPGARTLIQTMRAKGAYTALVSGGFTYFTHDVAARCGFDEHRANTLLDDGTALTGDVARPILGRASKLEVLRELSAARALPLDAALCIGDGANDTDMIKAAGLGISFYGKPALINAARARIQIGDLTSALYFQGIPKAAFVVDLPG